MKTEVLQQTVEIESSEIVRNYRELLQISYQTLTGADKKMIRKAFDIAVDAHQGQRRKTGDPYVFHPISVAKIVAQQIGMDAISIASALLHDVVEDTKYTLDDVIKLMGPTVGRIVDGLTKISHLKKDKDISLQAENFRKMLLTLNDDIRVIIIKIADRLHNMQTIDAMPEYKRIKIASETLYIYAPLAHRIGLYNIKTELEDLSLKCTDPKNYRLIKSHLEETLIEQDRYIESFNEFLRNALEKERIRCSIQGRTKSIYSIYKKMVGKNISIEQVYDKFAIRIVYKSSPVKEKLFAWKVYSIVTDHFTPNPSRLRDWISAPKSNGYEALHITIMGPQNKWIEVQIRSDRMHEVAEKGYAAHYKYKHGSQTDMGIDDWLNKLHEVLHNNTGNAVDFVEEFKLNLYADEIYVFTPKGDIKSLPQNSTALDFAFAIHTEIGKKTRGVMINGKLVPLNQALKNGDTVEILTSEKAKPNSNWIDYVITSRAKARIRHFLRQERNHLVAEGKEIVRRKFRQVKIPVNDRSLLSMIRYFQLQSVQELYYKIGSNIIDNKRFKEFVIAYNNSFINFFKKRLSPSKKPVFDAPQENQFVLVFGEENQELEHKLSSCCNPIPGEQVFGFVTKSEGIKVHSRQCKNAIALNSQYAYRIIKANWVNPASAEFKSCLIISGIDNKGLVHKITQLILDFSGIEINKIEFTAQGELFNGLLEVSLKDKNSLDNLVRNLKKIEGIEKIVRKK